MFYLFGDGMKTKKCAFVGCEKLICDVSTYCQSHCQIKNHYYCIDCGQEVFKRRTPRCDDCKSKLKSNKIEVPCNECGKILVKFLCQVYNTNYCDRACKGKAHSKVFMGENHPGWNKELHDTLTEEVLRTEYLVNKLSMNQIKTKYNLKHGVFDLLHKYNIPIRSVSEATKLNTPRGKDNWMFEKKFIGHESFHWKGGIGALATIIRGLKQTETWRKEIFERDNYTCVKCHKRGVYLHANHIKEFKNILADFLAHYSQFSPIEDKETLARLAYTWQSFWDINNGETMCKECHYNHHFPNRNKELLGVK